MRSVVPFLFVASIAACTPELPEGVFVCATTADCPPSMSCDTGLARCVSGVVETDASACTADQVQSVDGCVDRNECATPNVCGAGQDTCTNLVPGYTCSCTNGFVPSFDARECLDVQECANGADDCTWNASCSNTEGSFTCTCDYGFATAQEPGCHPTCVPAADSDSGSIIFLPNHVEMTDSTVGYDVDGLNNAARGSAGGGVGRTIPGCDTSDLENGIDNSFRGVVEAFAGSLDIEAELDAEIAADTFPVNFAISKLASGGAAQDPCVAVNVTIDGSSSLGLGALDAHVLSVTFANPIRIPVIMAVPLGGCGGGGCNPGRFYLFVRGARMRIVLNSTNTAFTEANLGGYAFFADSSSAAYDSLNTDGLRQAMIDYAASTNMIDSLRDTLIGAFSGARDIHMNTDSTRDACSAPGGDLTMIDRNAVSVGFRFTP